MSIPTRSAAVFSVVLMSATVSPAVDLTPGANEGDRRGGFIYGLPIVMNYA
jgi:hypothetical protein